MTTARDRIIEMMESGKVSADDGQALLAALDKRRRWQVLFNPFVALHEGIGLALTFLGALVSVLVAVTFRVRFDGALDLHIVDQAPTWGVAAFDAINATVTTALVLWLAALVLGRRARIRDFVVAVGVSRWPVVVGAIGIALVSPGRAETLELATKNPAHPRLLLLALLAVPVLVWQVTLLYTGFKVASGLKSARLVAGFIVALLAAEVLTKLLLLILPLGK